ncbi:ectonucleoside triphosphate diphosphohydrolase 3 [Histomonas meleagridis]|uniref:ectonucleoside triphosphate diphosphohydrolase 3 n=1 Tax=Histomonas meleagridis TaxID=135588 RepID=UPI00355AAB19|nr:ectonucleoside triphosphate diphosphohydrolase 3 [Histomonas meleagridis]KAH0799336.1 ectonucleoside triphosphate diphosphohydrolase 3 [Histomonas meleagridis]
MIDAGSSGTRAHIYQWDSSDEFPNVQPVSEGGKPCFIKIKIPIAKSAKNMTLIPVIFNQIISFCIKHIPPAYLPKTRIFVYATAGMRLLTDLEQEMVIGTTYRYLIKSSPFKVKPNYIRIISGIEEGIYGWLSVNHLLGNFVHKNPTVGALDMGGASFQVALEVSDQQSPVHTVTIGDKRINIYAHSYLGYGANEALKSITRSLYAVFGSSGKPFEHPCYNNGYNGSYHGISFVGTGDFGKCSTFIQEILLQASPFSSVEIPSLEKTNSFVAMASFYYINSFFNLTAASSLDELKDKSQEFCKKNWNDLSKTYGNDEYVLTYCFASVYQWNMLAEGLGFQERKTKVAKHDDINGVDLSWTIGAMLSQAGEIEIDEKPALMFPVLILANVISFLVLLPVFIIHERKRMTPSRFAVM